MKKTTASTPTGLFGANAACCQRLALLAQQSQQRWLALGQRLYGGAAAEYLSTLAPLKASGNWQEIAPALGEVTRKQWQAQLEASKALTHAALEEQAALAAGWSEAMNGWLHDAAGAATGLAATPVTQFWSNMSDQVASACAAMREATQAGVRHGQ